MVVIVLVVPSPTNGHINSDKNEIIHHKQQYDINNNHEPTWSLKNEIAKTYNYAARDYRKSNNVANGGSSSSSSNIKRNKNRFVDNNSKYFNNVNGHHASSLKNNNFVKSDAYNNFNCSNNNYESNRHKNNYATKNFTRHITRITISDDFSQTEIGSDQLAEAVTKEGEFLKYIFIYNLCKYKFSMKSYDYFKFKNYIFRNKNLWF